MHWYSIGCMFQLMLTIRWHDDTLRHQTHPKTLKMEVQAIISQVISRLSRPSFWKSVDPMVSRTAPGEARRICNRSLKKSKTQSYAMLRDATRHRTGRSAWEEFLQKTGCKMIWIVEDRPFGGLAYGVWRDMARSLAGTCVSTVSTYFGITRRFSTVGPVGIANCQLYSDCFTQTESYQSPVPDSVLQAREHQAFFQVNVLTCKWSRWGITNVCDILWLCFQHSAWCKIC